MLPFRKISNLMVTELIYSTVFWKNSFPHADNIHNQMSPRAIASGTSIDYHKHCHLENGGYVQTHKEHDNSMRPRTTGAIALRPMNNAQGGWHFMSLATGRKLQRYTWTELPMPKETMDRVHTLARRYHTFRSPSFYSRDGISILHDNTIETAGAEDENNVADDDSDNSYSVNSQSDSDSSEAPDTNSGDETASTDSSYHTSDDSQPSSSSSTTYDDDNDSCNGDDNLIPGVSSQLDNDNDNGDNKLDRILNNDPKP